MSIRFETLESKNQHLLDTIAPEVFDDPVEAKHLAEFVADPRHLMILAVDRDTVVGMVSATECLHPDKPRQLFINEIGVAPTHRRQGIGRELVESLLDAARARGCDYAWLGTDVDNVAGQACFGSVAGGEEPQPFLLYEWKLDD